MDRAKLIGLATRKPHCVKVEDPKVLAFFGEAVWLRVMSGRDSDSYYEGNYRTEGKKLRWQCPNIKARLLVRCLCDEQGQRLLNDDDAGDIGKYPDDILAILVERAQDLNGMSDESQEQILGNSANGQTSCGGTESPATSS